MFVVSWYVEREVSIQNPGDFTRAEGIRSQQAKTKYNQKDWLTPPRKRYLCFAILGMLSFDQKSLVHTVLVNMPWHKYCNKHMDIATYRLGAGSVKMCIAHVTALAIVNKM